MQIPNNKHNRNKQVIQNHERGGNMKKSNKKNTVHNSNTGAKDMIRKTKKANEGFAHKLGTAHQQNLVEMLGYIYLYPKAYTKTRLAHEFMKNGVESEQKIIRMVNSVNTFCPVIKRALREFDFRSYYYLDENRFSESDFDSFYQKSQNAAMVYIFLIALLVRPISTEDVMEKLQVKKSAANKLIEKILDASFVIDDVETPNGHVIGYHLY